MKINYYVNFIATVIVTLRHRAKPAKPQVNGKLRGSVTINVDAIDEVIIAAAMELSTVQAALTGLTIKKTIEFENNFHRNLKSSGMKWSWGLDGCARWRKLTITVAIKCNWKIIFKGIE